MPQFISTVAAALEPAPPENVKVGTVLEVIGLPWSEHSTATTVCALASVAVAVAPDPAVTEAPTLAFSRASFTR